MSTSLALAVEARVADLTAAQRSLLLERRPSDEGKLRDAVRAILERVRTEGDAALLDFAQRFDRVELTALEIPRARWEEALASLDPAVRAGLERAAVNIRRFHEAQIPPDVTLEVEPGVVLGRRAVPLRAVGVYAPGGLAAYPSSVLMGVVPARAAGVRDVVVCSPPGPSGEPSAEVLAACAIGGATRLFAVGGAGAVAALAFGTESVPRVDAIVGPGNVWVTEAKRQVAGDLLIDSPAGPSEVLVVADSLADPRLVALELVAQAEHDPQAAVAVVSPSPELLARVREALAEEVARAPRRAVIEEALRDRGGLVLAASMDEALEFAEAYAAEHLAIYTVNAEADLERMTTAGTVFVGQGATVAFGDYMTGANHVLPTAGLSRAFSGLSVLHFLRFFTHQRLTADAAADMAEPVAILADAEGLPGHAAAARARARSHSSPSPRSSADS
jgi:histidinol dehydrogenase